MAFVLNRRAFTKAALLAGAALAYRPVDAVGAEGVRKRRRTFASREQAYANFQRKVPFSRWHPDALGGYISGGLRDVPEGAELACHPEYEAEVYETATAHGALELVGLVKGTVDVMVGDRSDTVDLELAERMVQALPNGRLTVVPGAGHLIPMEQPDDVASAVRRLVA